MQQYHKLLETILEHGVNKNDRTGTGTCSIFGHQMRFDLRRGFPLVTTKKVHLRSIIYELLWFISGDTNIKFLNDNKVTIWNEWADKDGNLGPVYGAQWRRWLTSEGQAIDQLSELIHNIKTSPDSRRLIMNAWNVGELSKMALPPCHAFVQFYVAQGRLSCQLYQRSADVFLGVPFNIASYALLLMMIAQVTGLEAHEFVHVLGDAHIYNNHFNQVRLQLTRRPQQLPRMRINSSIKSIFDFKFEDFNLENYESHPPIKAEISV